MNRVFLLTVAAFVISYGGDFPSAPTNASPTTRIMPAASAVTAVTVTGTGCANGGACTAPGNLQLSAIAQLSNGTTQTVTSSASWTSSNTSVADVSAAGAVTVHHAGTADILANCQGRQGGVTVSVPAPWSRSGSGDTVLDMPTYVSRVRITGRHTGYMSNFVVYIGGRLIVNELLGTGGNQVDFAGTYMTSGGTVEIQISSGVQWSLTQVRQ